MPSVQTNINIMPVYVRGAGIHDDQLLPGHLDRVKKFSETGDIMDLYPSAPGSDKKLRSKFGSLDFASLQAQPSIFMVSLDVAEDTGGRPGVVLGDCPLRIAALMMAKREARPATPAEVAEWFEAGVRRKQAQDDEELRRISKADRTAIEADNIERRNAALREQIELEEKLTKLKGGK